MIKDLRSCAFLTCCTPIGAAVCAVVPKYRSCLATPAFATSSLAGLEDSVMYFVELHCACKGKKCSNNQEPHIFNFKLYKQTKERPALKHFWRNKKEQLLGQNFGSPITNKKKIAL